MIAEDREADFKMKVKLAGMELTDDADGAKPLGSEYEFAPDPLVQSPLWQAHNRAIQRDAQNRRN
jgi:hypothetical protein